MTPAARITHHSGVLARSPVLHRQRSAPWTLRGNECRGTATPVRFALLHRLGNVRRGAVVPESTHNAGRLFPRVDGDRQVAAFTAGAEHGGSIPQNPLTATGRLMYRSATRRSIVVTSLLARKEAETLRF